MTSEATKQQPPPQKNDSPAVWPLVIADLPMLTSAPEWLRQRLADDMAARHELGMERYGMPLRVENGRDAAVDAYQEALDLCAYARQRLEQTGSLAWNNICAQSLGMAAGIRYLMDLDRDTRDQGEG